MLLALTKAFDQAKACMRNRTAVHSFFTEVIHKYARPFWIQLLTPGAFQELLDIGTITVYTHM